MDKTMKAMKEFKLGKKNEPNGTLVGGRLNAFKACKTAQKAAPGWVFYMYISHKIPFFLVSEFC